MISLALKKRLSVNGFFKVKHLKSVGSTNEYLKTLSPDKLREGFVVVADEQTGGKGRLGRKFFSPKGGLYFSMLLKPANRDVLDKLTLIAAVATADAIKMTCGDDVSIKWVNDIYIGSKKCCGILSETTENLKGFAIVGIGVNICGVPKEVEDIACGVTDIGGSTRFLLLESILSNFLELYQDFDGAKVVGAYKDRCSTIGKSVSVFENDGNEYMAQAIDIDDGGHLVVLTGSGEKRILSSGEVKITL